jgi:S1-C subfamily serine protease
MKKGILAGITTFLVLASILFAGMFIGEQFSIFERAEERKEEATKEREAEEKRYKPSLEHEEMIISVVEENLPAVVSIVSERKVMHLDFPRSDIFHFFEEIEREERLEVEQGTGFIISSDGLILTNKHVVVDENAKYNVFLSSGERLEAEVLARDPMQDLAVLKVERENLPTVTIGNSDGVRPGQTAIAIGNALGEFKNTVSVGVVSGVGRRITAYGGQTVEILDDVIQTDAAINFGNSGGPLLNLKGEVIGINTATMTRAEGMGFAIPINKAKRAIEGAKTEGRIVYPFLGVRYLIVDENIKEEEGISVDYGAIVIGGGRGRPAIVPDSAAEEAGIRERDIILEIDGKKITKEKTLAMIITEYNPGEEIELKILRNDKEFTINVVLGEID